MYNKKISIVIVNYNGLKYLEKCFNSIYGQNYPKEKMDIIFVDNKSEDNSVNFIRKNYPKVKIIINDENNYCKALNKGVLASKTDYVVTLNNDVKLDKNWLIELIKLIDSDTRIAAVGSKVFLNNGKINTTGIVEAPYFYFLERGFNEEDHGQYDNIEEVNFLCGVSVIYRKKCLLEVGLFDEDFVMYYDDVEISKRLRDKNYKLYYCPNSFLYHEQNGTSKLLSNIDNIDRYVERNRLLFIAKHYPEKIGEYLNGKGFYSKESEDINEVLPTILNKMIKEHPPKKVLEIMPSIFENLGKIKNHKQDYLTNRVIALKSILAKKDITIHKMNNDIKNIQNSFGYKVILSPLWGFWNLLKGKKYK